MHNSTACLFSSRSGALKSLGVRIGEDKWCESYPQSGPNERSEGDAHILSAKRNKTIPPKACLNANWTVMQSRRHLFVSSFGQWFISIRHRIHTFGMRSMNRLMPLKINFINPLSVQYAPPQTVWTIQDSFDLKRTTLWNKNHLLHWFQSSTCRFAGTSQLKHIKLSSLSCENGSL